MPPSSGFDVAMFGCTVVLACMFGCTVVLTCMSTTGAKATSPSIRQQHRLMLQQLPCGIYKKGQGMGLGSRLRPAVWCPCLQKGMRGWACHHPKIQQSLAIAVVSSAASGLDVTMSAFLAGSL